MHGRVASLLHYNCDKILYIFHTFCLISNLQGCKTIKKVDKTSRYSIAVYSSKYKGGIGIDLNILANDIIQLLSTNIGIDINNKSNTGVYTSIVPNNINMSVLSDDNIKYIQQKIYDYLNKYKDEWFKGYRTSWLTKDNIIIESIDYNIIIKKNDKNIILIEFKSENLDKTIKNSADLHFLANRFNFK